MVDDVLCLSNPVHFWHVYVCEDTTIAHVAALLCHVFLVHLDSYEAIDGLITPPGKLILDDCFERQQVEHYVVDKKHLCLRAAGSL